MNEPLPPAMTTLAQLDDSLSFWTKEVADGGRADGQIFSQWRAKMKTVRESLADARTELDRLNADLGRYYVSLSDGQVQVSTDRDQHRASIDTVGRVIRLVGED